MHIDQSLSAFKGKHYQSTETGFKLMIAATNDVLRTLSFMMQDGTIIIMPFDDFLKLLEEAKLVLFTHHKDDVRDERLEPIIYLPFTKADLWAEIYQDRRVQLENYIAEDFINGQVELHNRTLELLAARGIKQEHLKTYVLDGTLAKRLWRATQLYRELGDIGFNKRGIDIKSKNGGRKNLQEAIKRYKEGVAEAKVLQQEFVDSIGTSAETLDTGKPKAFSKDLNEREPKACIPLDETPSDEELADALAIPVSASVQEIVEPVAVEQAPPTGNGQAPYGITKDAVDHSTTIPSKVDTDLTVEQMETPVPQSNLKAAIKSDVSAQTTTEVKPPDPSDLLTNSSGVYTEETAGDRLEKLVIPFTKSSKCIGTISIIQGSDNKWRKAISIENGTEGFSYGVSVRGAKFLDQKTAIRSAIAEVRSFLLKSPDFVLSVIYPKDKNLKSALNGLREFAALQGTEWEPENDFHALEGNDARVEMNAETPEFLYHGTCVPFDKFEESALGSNAEDCLSYLGFHFTPDIDVAFSIFANLEHGGSYDHCRTLVVEFSPKKTLFISESTLVKTVLSWGSKQGIITHEGVDIDALLELPYDSSSERSLLSALNFDNGGKNEKPLIDIETISRRFVNEVLRPNGFDTICYVNEIESPEDTRPDWIVLDTSLINIVDEIKVERSEKAIDNSRSNESPNDSTEKEAKEPKADKAELKSSLSVQEIRKQSIYVESNGVEPQRAHYATLSEGKLSLYQLETELGNLGIRYDKIYPDLYALGLPYEMALKVQALCEDGACKVEFRNLQMGHAPESYFAPNDTTMSFSEYYWDFENPDEEEREFQTSDVTWDETERWKEKYDIDKEDQVIFVNTNKWLANIENLSPYRQSLPYDVAENELKVVEIAASDGFIIPESDDGDHGLLFVYREHDVITDAELVVESLEEKTNPPQEDNGAGQADAIDDDGFVNVPVSLPDDYLDRVVAYMQDEYMASKRVTKKGIETLKQTLGVPNLGKMWEAAELSWMLWYKMLYNEPMPFEQRLKKMVHFWNKVQPTFAYSDSSKELYRQYSTSCPISAIVAEYTMMARAEKVFEPCAGNGLLLIGAKPKTVHANEIDKTRLDSLRFQQFGTLTSLDASQPFPKDMEQRFDVMVTNPPFAKWEADNYDKEQIARTYFNDQIGIAKNIRLEHMMAGLALRTMKDNGRAAIIIMGHIHFDDQGLLAKYRPFFNWLCRHYHVDDIINMNSFKMYNKQGAVERTMLILINGRKSVPSGVAPTKQESPQLDQMVDNFEELWHRVKPHLNPSMDTIIEQLKLELAA